MTISSHCSVTAWNWQSALSRWFCCFWYGLSTTICFGAGKKNLPFRQFWEWRPKRLEGFSLPRHLSWEYALSDWALSSVWSAHSLLLQCCSPPVEKAISRHGHSFQTPYCSLCSFLSWSFLWRDCFICVPFRKPKWLTCFWQIGKMSRIWEGVIGFMGSWYSLNCSCCSCWLSVSKNYIFITTAVTRFWYKRCFGEISWFLRLPWFGLLYGCSEK